ncbi:MAG TPA: Hsp70 family protein [Chloroflexia bacterium]|nr:Hsp70 family protein [Chloroflexia bacterium]
MLYGIDFGTSNSAISLMPPEEPVKVLPVDKDAPRPEIMSTLIYIRRDGATVTGHTASEAYFRDNVGREIVKQLINTGTFIKSYIDGYGEVTEALVVETDANMPGRFFQAIKSFLAEDGYGGTDVFGTFMTIEELVALFLRTLKLRADEMMGQEIEGVVLGRPVFFSPEGRGDVLAQQRLRSAAEQAGFKEIHFQYEPVAAALHYEAEIASGEENVLVFDFGGGTLDTTVVRVGPHRHHLGDRRDDILATDGRVIGGNTLDEEIMEKKLFKYFGENARWSEQQLTLPHYIFAMLRQWYTIPNLQQQRIYSFLEEISRFSSGRRQIKALECLIRKNYGYSLFQEIERAKVELSSKWETRINFFQEAIAISEYLGRPGFEAIISGHLRRIENCLDETLAAAGLEAAQIGAVLRTGGSSYIPAVQKMLERKFGAEKLRFQDAFANVASGLGVAAARGTFFD